MDLMKTCQKCNTQLSVSVFSRNKSTKDGLQSRCKDCVKVYNEENKAKISEYHKNYREGNRPKIAKTKKIYRTANKVRLSEYGKDYYKANKDRIVEFTKVYYIENKAKLIEYQKNYAKANPSKYNARSAKRRSIKLNATPPWLTEEHFKQIEEFYIKSQSLSQSTGVKHHVDHICPLQGETVCGLHVPWNLQILTASENASKSNKLQT